MERSRRSIVGGLIAFAASCGLGGCALPFRHPPPPETVRTNRPSQDFPAYTRVQLDGKDDEVLSAIAVESVRRELGQLGREADASGGSSFLAISGGGADGAFGAGILTGWSTLGTRPAFKCVTGVSTGALTAPFAFLGSAWDSSLERVYTEISQEDVVASRGILTALFDDSLYDSAPLRRMIRGFLTAAFVAAIAREYRENGRLLFVATTNLDIPVGVLWNIGAIAASGHPHAVELLTDVLLASASVPGAFPPVMIDIEVEGHRYQEMHVDGGTVAQVVVYPPSFAIESSDAAVLRRLATRRRRLYIIRNSRLGSNLQTIDRSALKIAGRAVSTLISTQGVGDLYELYVLCQRDGISYNVTYIPESFTQKQTGLFDRAYMNALYRLGRERIGIADAWSSYPPGYNPTPLAGGKRSAAAPTATP